MSSKDAKSDKPVDKSDELSQPKGDADATNEQKNELTTSHHDDADNKGKDIDTNHDTNGYKTIDETPTFDKVERSKLGNIIHTYFIENNLVKLEKHMDYGLLQKLGVSLDETGYCEFITAATTRQSELKQFSFIQHQDDLWKSIYFKCKNQGLWSERIKLWNLIQHQTIHLITNIYKFPESIRNELDHCIFYSNANPPKPQTEELKDAPYLNTMEIGTVNMDCIVTGIKLKKAGYNPMVLNLANQEAPAAATHHRSEGGTQEENLFKRSTLYLSLWPHRNPNVRHNPTYDYFSVFGEDDDDEELYLNTNEMEQKENKNKNKDIKGFYPMDNKCGGAYSKNVYVFRGSEQSGYCMLPLNQRCVLSFVAVAAQIHYGGETLSKQEITAFENKIRTIYRIGLENGHDALVLGAMGCGIFNNPPLEVASIFHRILVNEFNGLFARVVFAILWDHNSRPQLVQSFTKYFPQNDKVFNSL